MSEWLTDLKQLNIGKIETDTSLKKFTTYRVGGKARCVIYPKNTENLVKLMKFIRSRNIKYKMLGNGSNLIFSDDLFDGILIKLTEFDNIEVTNNKIKVGAGYSLMKLSRVALKNSLTGLEFAAGIPGTVGGAIFMNAGAYKSDMGYIVQSVKVLTKDFKIVELENKEMNFHYRTSFLQKHPDYICLEAIIRLEKGKKDAIEEVMKSRLKRRVESQPLNYPSAGSVFRNPTGMFAGELIEKCGLKGYKLGGAMISDKHANFVINTGDAKASDVRDLINIAREKVKAEYNVDLRVEQEFVNWE
ncbi:MAG: UDP-N-acetylmuramate dehydrogenase [bacterium]|nr:UDP-N-acetylmuramate dehydrogenase [bacterium]